MKKDFYAKKTLFLKDLDEPPLMHCLKKQLIRLYLLLLGRSIFLGFNRFLFRLGLRGMGCLNDESIYDSGETRFLKRFFKNKSNLTVIDVGARYGSYANYIKRIAPTTRIICLDPNPRVFSHINKNAKKYNYTFLPVAASSTIGESELIDFFEPASGSAYASLQPSAISNYKHDLKKKITVKTETIDNLITSHKIKKIDLLKIDTEGNELEIIKGASNAILNGLISVIQFEIDSINADLKIFLSDFEKLLPNFNFFRILPDGRLLSVKNAPIVEKEIFAFQNLVAIKRG